MLEKRQSSGCSTMPRTAHMELGSSRPCKQSHPWFHSTRALPYGSQEGCLQAQSERELGTPKQMPQSLGKERIETKKYLESRFHLLGGKEKDLVVPSTMCARD